MNADKNLKKGLLREKDRFSLKVLFFNCEGKGDSERIASVIRENQTGFPYEERSVLRIQYK